MKQVLLKPVMMDEVFKSLFLFGCFIENLKKII